MDWPITGEGWACKRQFMVALNVLTISEAKAFLKSDDDI